MTLRYDYAWQVPGWSTQNPTFAGPTDGYAHPGMPEDVTLVHLYGAFMEFDTGRSLESVLRLRVDKTLTHVPSGQGVMGGPMKVYRFNRYRPLSLWLPATDDPDLTPSFEYEARLTVRGQKFNFTFPLPRATPEVNINTLINQPANASTLEILSPDSSGTDITLGSSPLTLRVILVENSDFVTTVDPDVDWQPDTTVSLNFDNGAVWTATLTPGDASFQIPALQANTIPSGTEVSLQVRVGTATQVWAKGRVTRRD